MNKNLAKRAENTQSGLMTVEAAMSLVPFIMVILGIISFTNIFMVHNKIQYALYQVGSELSGYTYFYEALGLRSADLALKSDIDIHTAPVDQTIDDVSSFIGQLNTLTTSVGGMGENGAAALPGEISDIYHQGQGVIQSGQAVGTDVKKFIKDPKSLLRGLVYLGIEAAENAGKQLLISWLGSGMMENYLDESFLPQGAMSADTFLKKMGVRGGLSGLDYGKSQLFQDSGCRMIDLVVEYDVEIYFLKLFLKDPVVHVSQRVTIPAWLDGDGVRYTKE